MTIFGHTQSERGWIENAQVPASGFDPASGTLFWPKLIPGTLVRRYKRFLADIRLDDGEVVCAHCPNSGRMTACCDAGRPVYISPQNGPKRKLKFTWELIRMPDSLVGVNTLVPNRLIYHLAENGSIPELSGYRTVQKEVRAGAHTRFDLALTGSGKRKCFVEIKNCTLVEGRVAAFPDAVTARGRSHLVELQKQVSEGCRGLMFYVVQRMDAEVFAPADHIDPEYGRELRKAVENGVELVAYDTEIDPRGIRLRNRLPLRL